MILRLRECRTVVNRLTCDSCILTYQVSDSTEEELGCLVSPFLSFVTRYLTLRRSESMFILFYRSTNRHIILCVKSSWILYIHTPLMTSPCILLGLLTSCAYFTSNKANKLKEIKWNKLRFKSQLEYWAKVWVPTMPFIPFFFTMLSINRHLVSNLGEKHDLLDCSFL